MPAKMQYGASMVMMISMKASQQLGDFMAILISKMKAKVKFKFGIPKF